MLNVVTLRLTDEELNYLDQMKQSLKLKSRSDVIRKLLNNSEDKIETTNQSIEELSKNISTIVKLSSYNKKLLEQIFGQLGNYDPNVKQKNCFKEFEADVNEDKFLS